MADQGTGVVARRNIYHRQSSAAKSRGHEKEKTRPLQHASSTFSSTDSAISLGQLQALSKIGLYTLREKIGVGMYGSVKRASHRVANHEVAIKILRKDRLDMDALQKVYREIEVQKRLHHPYVIELFQVMETADTIYLVTELAARGELYRTIKIRQKLPEKEARRYFYQLVKAVEYCHQRGVVHRDIKPENLLLDEYDNLKLADFGFSNFFSSSDLMKSFCGSPQYAAPEVFLGIEYVGPLIDVWSMGVILYVFLTGATPFEGRHFTEIRDQVLYKTINFPFFISHEAAGMLKMMLSRDAKKRPSIGQILKHRWLKGDNLEETIAAEIKAHRALDECVPREKLFEIMQDLDLDREIVTQDVHNNRFNNVDGFYRILVSKWKNKKLKDFSTGSLTMETFLVADEAVRRARGETEKRTFPPTMAIDSQPLVKKITQALEALSLPGGPEEPFCSDPRGYPFEQITKAIDEEERENEAALHQSLASAEDESPMSVCAQPARKESRMDSVESSEGYGGTADTSAFSTRAGSLTSVHRESLARITSDFARRLDEMNIAPKRRSIAEPETGGLPETTGPLPKRPSLPECLGIQAVEQIFRPILPLYRPSQLTDAQMSSSRDKKTLFRLKAQMKRHERKARIERSFQNEKREDKSSSSRNSWFLPPPMLVEGGSFDDTTDDPPPPQTDSAI